MKETPNLSKVFIQQPIYFLLQRGERYTAASDMWSLGAVLSFIANKGKDLFESAEQVRRWKGGKSTLDNALYSIDLRQLIADLLCPTPESRPTAKKLISEGQKETRQKKE